MEEKLKPKSDIGNADEGNIEHMNVEQELVEDAPHFDLADPVEDPMASPITERAQTSGLNHKSRGDVEMPTDCIVVDLEEEDERWVQSESQAASSKHSPQGPPRPNSGQTGRMSRLNGRRGKANARRPMPKAKEGGWEMMYKRMQRQMKAMVKVDPKYEKILAGKMALVELQISAARNEVNKLKKCTSLEEVEGKMRKIMDELKFQALKNHMDREQEKNRLKAEIARLDNEIQQRLFQQKMQRRARFRNA